MVLFLVPRDERWKERGGGHAEKGRERREREKGGREGRERRDGEKGRERRKGEKGRERRKGEKGGREGRERREEHDNCLLPYHHSPCVGQLLTLCRMGGMGLKSLCFLRSLKLDTGGREEGGGRGRKEGENCKD